VEASLAGVLGCFLDAAVLHPRADKLASLRIGASPAHARSRRPRASPNSGAFPAPAAHPVPGSTVRVQSMANMALYIALYLLGVLIGLGASIALDVQLRRPGIRQAIGLIIFALLLWGFTALTHKPFTEVLLPLVWAGTGLLAGLGSRGAHAPG
jgi:hypothetical protein